MGAAWHPLGLAAGFRPALLMDGCHEPCGLGEPCGAVCWALKSWRRSGGLELVFSVLPESLGQLVKLGPVLGLIVVGQQPPQLVLPPRVFGLPGGGSRSLGACWSGARAGGWAQGRHRKWWRSHGFLWPKCSLVGEDWPRWLWWLPLGRGFHPCCCGLRGGVVARLVKSMPSTGGGSGGVLGRDLRWWRLRDFLCRTWGPRCLGGRLWSVRGSGWDGGWLHRTGWVLELGRCYRCWSLGGGCCFTGWRGFAGQLRGLDLRTAVLGFELLALVLGPKETGGPVGGFWCILVVGVVVGGNESGGGWGCRRKPLGGGWACHRRGSSRWRGVVGLEDCLCDGLACRWSLDWQQLLGQGVHRCCWVWRREGVGWEVGDWEVGWGEHGWSGLGQGGQLGRRERARKDRALGFGGMRGSRGGHGVWAAVWAAGSLRDIIHGCNVWPPKLW